MFSLHIFQFRFVVPSVQPILFSTISIPCVFPVQNAGHKGIREKKSNRRWKHLPASREDLILCMSMKSWECYSFSKFHLLYFNIPLYLLLTFFNAKAKGADLLFPSCHRTCCQRQHKGNKESGKAGAASPRGRGGPNQAYVRAFVVFLRVILGLRLKA